MSDADDDRSLFAEAMRGVRRLRHEPRVNRVKTPPQRDPASVAAKQSTPRHDPWSDGSGIETVGAGSSLFFAHPGLQQSVLRKLRQGRLSIDAEIDLHGMTVAEARNALNHALDEAGSSGLRCLRIITGKGNRDGTGQARLKSHVNHWLRQDPRLLAFATQPPRHGGEGALVALIRNPLRR